MKKLREMLNKEYSSTVASNWYFAMGAAIITASFYAPSDDSQWVLIMIGVIVIVAAQTLYGDK